PGTWDLGTLFEEISYGYGVQYHAKRLEDGFLECLPGKSKGDADHSLSIPGCSLQDLLLCMIAMAVSTFQVSVTSNYLVFRHLLARLSFTSTFLNLNHEDNNYQSPRRINSPHSTKAQSHHQGPSLLIDDSYFVRSSLEEANRIYQALTRESTLKDESSSPNIGTPYPFFVPSTVQSTLGSPTALAIGAFSTTLTTLSFSLMGWRGLDVTNVFIGNFFFVAGIGMVVSAQWELVLGNSFGYTALSAFGMFLIQREGQNPGFGAILTPLFGVKESYGDDTIGYNNALGFWVLMWAVLNLFFVFGAMAINLLYIGIFFFVELALALIAASYFAAADGKPGESNALKVSGGVFAFLAGILGYYTVAHLMCQTALFYRFPMGDTSRFFVKRKRDGAEECRDSG
ncbi:Acetate transporter protein patA, partial [Lachnellula cervina]